MEKADDHSVPYIAKKVTAPSDIKINGKCDSVRWKDIEKSQRFVDMLSGQPGVLNTQAAVCWDDENMYVAFWIEEPFPTAQFTERDSIIFRENDVEVFIDGGDCYYEFEINARNTIYEVFFIWKDSYKRRGKFDIPEFDLLDRKAFTFAGDFDRTPDTFWYGTHPRGVRYAFLDWDFPGVQSSVHVDGVLNDRSTISKGWTVEIAFPWAGMKHLANGRSLPPKPGDVWKMFFGRFQKFPFGDKETQAAWCWTPHGVLDTHQPHKFTAIQFQ